MCPERLDVPKGSKRKKGRGRFERVPPVGETREAPDLDNNRDLGRMEYAEEFTIPRTPLDREPTTWAERRDE